MNPLYSSFISEQTWEKASQELEASLKQPQLEVCAENQSAQILCDASLGAARCPQVDPEAAFAWWEQCLLDFRTGGYPIDPLLPRALVNRVRASMQQLSQTYSLIKERKIDELLSEAHEALKAEGSEYLIPIIYQSQTHGKPEAILAVFSREQGSLQVRLMTRGEGMRLHPLLEQRGGKRLYSYTCRQMTLRDQQLFYTSGVLGLGAKPSELGQEWIKQLIGHQNTPTCPQEIYAVFQDVLAKENPEELDERFACSPQRSPTGLQRLPGLLLRHYRNEELAPERLKRFGFAVKARALHQVLANVRAGTKLDTELVRDELAELNSSAKKLREQGILDDADLTRILVLCSQLEAALPQHSKPAVLPEHCPGASSTWQANPQRPFPLLESRERSRAKHEAQEVAAPLQLNPKPQELLACLQQLQKAMRPCRIAELTTLLTNLPLPNVQGKDPYWDAIPQEQLEETLSSLRALMQAYGNALHSSDETELPRALLAMGTALCIADTLARRLKDDPLKLQGFGLSMPSVAERFFFHRREQTERWQELQRYIAQRNAGTKHQLFSYYWGQYPWAILSYKADPVISTGSNDQLHYFKQFDPNNELPLSRLIARRFVCKDGFKDGLELPKAYDDLHYFAASLRRLCHASRKGKAEQLSRIISCDQIPVLLRYDKVEKDQGYAMPLDSYKLIYCSAEGMPENEKQFLQRHKQRSKLQSRQAEDYSKEAVKQLFPIKLETENQLLYHAAKLGDLPQAAVHALQKILRLERDSDYRLQLSELMDFCQSFPLATNDQDVRLVIESVLLSDDKLYQALRETGGQELYEQVQGFLRTQRQRVHGSVAGLDELLAWQRLSLDVEQRLPQDLVQAEGEIPSLMQELSFYSHAQLSDQQQAAIALQKAYFFSFQADREAELLSCWIEARTLHEKTGQKSLGWLEGELKRHIQLHAARLKAYVPRALQLLGDFLPEGLDWSENAGIYTAASYSLDPLAGYLLEDDKPYGAPAERAPRSLRESVQRLLNTERCPTLTMGPEQTWQLKQDPELKFIPRRHPPQKKFPVRLGQHWGWVSCSQVDEPWRLPADMQLPGHTYWVSTYAGVGDLGQILLIEEPDGKILSIRDGKTLLGEKSTFGSYWNKDLNHTLDKRCELSLQERKRLRDEAIKAYEARHQHLAVRDIAVDGQVTRWQALYTNGGLPQELLQGQQAFVECIEGKPRILLVDQQGKAKTVLTQTDGGYQVRDLERACLRVTFSEAPWNALADASATLVWAKDEQVQAVDYPYLGLSFERREQGFECLQMPGYFVQADAAPELPGLACQVLLKNAHGEQRLLLRSTSGYDIYRKEARSAGWKAPDTAAALRFVLHSAACGQPLAGLFMLDAIGDEQALSLSDWQSLVQLSQKISQAHGCSALLLKLAHRVMDLEDTSDAKKSLPLRRQFWSAVDRALIKNGQDSAVPLALRLSPQEHTALQAYPRPEALAPALRHTHMGGGWVDHALNYIPQGWGETPRQDFAAHWSKQELAAHVKTLMQEAEQAKQFPAPIDLQLRATLEHCAQGHMQDECNDRTRLNEVKKARMKAIEKLIEGRQWDKLALQTEALSHTERADLSAHPGLKAITLEPEQYTQRPFETLFTTCVEQEMKSLPADQVDPGKIFDAKAKKLQEALQRPLQQELAQQAPSTVACYRIKEGTRAAIEAQLRTLRETEVSLRTQVEASANACHSLVEACGLNAADFQHLSVEDVLVLFSPERPQALLARNPFLTADDLKQLMRDAIALMECGWQQSQLEEARRELSDDNPDACARILAKEQVFAPQTCWWRSLYQYMSGNMLRKEPDQSAAIERIFRCLEGKATDPSGEHLQQLYFEFQAGGGKTKLLSAIAALRCLNQGETPVFFSLPNLVDICKRDLKSALNNYFHKRCESIELGLSSQLDNAQLEQLVLRLERYQERPSCLVMTPEGYQFLQLEYKKALSMQDADQRIELLDRALRFFEEHAVFLIDEGHRNKDPLLNSNVAVGSPVAIPAAYRSLQQVVYRWLAKHPRLGLCNNDQAALTPEARQAIIRELLNYMLSLSSLAVEEELREPLINDYLLTKESPAPEWLTERLNSKDSQQQLQAQWIAQLRGLATSILPFSLSQKGMIDHGPALHSGCEVEVPRDHGQLSASQFEVPDIALALTYQGFLQRGLQSASQFALVIQQLQEQAKTQGSEHQPDQTPIEKAFRAWQGEGAVPLREIQAAATKSADFQRAFQALKRSPEIVLRYVASQPAGQVSLFRHRLVSTAASLSYGAKRCVSFSATLGMRSKYSYFGGDEAYCEDTAFVAKVMRQVSLSKNSSVTIDSSTSVEEFVASHKLDQAAGFLDFGGACGAQSSETWCQEILKQHKSLDGCLYAQQSVDQAGHIGEKLLFLKLRGQPARQLEGSDLKQILRSPELKGKQLLRLFAPEDTVGLDLHAGADAKFVITIGENACLDDLAQALLRARRFLENCADGEASQSVSWIVHEKIAQQIRDSLQLEESAPITTQDILRWSLHNMVARLQEAIQARAYQEIEGVYERLLRAELRGKPAPTQRALFEKCSSALFRASGYNPFAQWGQGCEQRPTREVLRDFQQQLHQQFAAFRQSGIPAWAEQRIEHVISETEQLLETLPSQRARDLRARQIQRQHAQAQQRQRQMHRQKQRSTPHRGKERSESRTCSEKLSIEKLPSTLEDSYLKPAQQLLDTALLPKNLLLTRDSFLTEQAFGDKLWELKSAKPMLHILVLKPKQGGAAQFIALSQEQARSYARQLAEGKQSEHFAAGLVDLQGSWSHAMQEPPETEDIRQAVALLNGRLQHPEHLRSLMQRDAHALSKLWQQLESLHIDAIPSWESVLAYISKETDPLKSVAKSCEELSIALPKRAPQLRNPYDTRELKCRVTAKPRQRKPARQPQSLNLAELRERLPHERQQAAPQAIEVRREMQPASPQQAEIKKLYHNAVETQAAREDEAKSVEAPSSGPNRSSWWRFLIPGALAFFATVGYLAWRWRARRLHLGS